jgi:lipoprotein-anchoring transpeptidase ErfK/SrfK
MRKTSALFLSLSILCLMAVSCGKSQKIPEPQSKTPSEFNYAEFIARTPVDHLNYDEGSALDSEEYDPRANNIDEVLEEWDKAYAELGISTHLEQKPGSTSRSNCKKGQCAVWVSVDKSKQTLSLYIDGVLEDSWLVSTGTAGHGTPDFETHPNGRIYDNYSSSTYPGGDYNGLGNMPYAVFISGGFALHGTPKGNWKLLGTKASHGCIRMHPDNGYRFNRLVREVGIENVWISVK